MSDAYYDVVVVGTELPGLITAAMLAKKGYRVLVLGHGSRPNNFAHEGHHFIRRPWLFSGFETSTPIKKVFAELSLSLEMQNRPKPFSPFYQVVMPDRRVDVVSKESLFQRELNREFPGELKNITSFYHAIRQQNDVLSTILDAPIILPPEGFFEKRSFKKLTEATLNGGVADPLRTFAASHPFRPFVLAPLLFGSGCQVEPYSAIQLIRAVTHLGRGLFHIEGGIDALKESFIEKVKNNCGDYRAKVQVDRFVMRRGKVREIVVRDRREVIGCDVVVCNTDVKRFFQLIPEEDQKQRFHLKIIELQPTHYLYTCNFAVNRQAIPEGMGRHVFLVDDPAAALDGENLLLLSVDANDRAAQSRDTAVLSVTARLRARTVRPTVDNIKSHERRLATRLRRLIPFLDEHLITTASSWIGRDKRTKKPFVDTSQMVSIFGTPLPDSLDSSPISCRTAYKNILVTGDHLHAGLGFEGAFLGSLNAVQLTGDLVNRKTLLSR